jgi:hypothetical protein
MSETIDPRASVVGLFYVKGVLHQKIKKADGTLLLEPVPGTLTVENEPQSAKDFISDADDDFAPHPDVHSFSDKFKDTRHVPHPDLQIRTNPLVVKSPLINKAVAKEIARLTETISKEGTGSDVIQKALTQLIDIIFAEHALLIRVVGSPESLADRKDPVYIKDSALLEYVQHQIDILKGPWIDVREKIKLRPSNFEAPPVVNQPGAK